MEITTIGLDLAKNVFQVHAVDAAGDVVVRKALRRAQLLPLVTGLVEVVGGLLLTPRFSAFGGLLLAVTMLCATGTHLFVIGGSPAGAIVLFLITATITWMRRGQFATLFKGR